MRIDLDNHIRGVLKAFGLKVGKIATGQFEARVWELIDDGDAQIRWVVGTMLTTRAAVISQRALLQRAVLAAARQDEVCRRLMTVPGVGAVTALAFKTAVDEPARFPNSAALGAYFGLTPSKYASGETDYTGHITQCGDKAVRALLCEAANVLLTRVSRWSWVKRWGLEVLKRRQPRRNHEFRSGGSVRQGRRVTVTSTNPLWWPDELAGSTTTQPRRLMRRALA